MAKVDGSTLQILPCFSLKVRCNLGPFIIYWLSEVTSQLLQETHSHQDLVGQEFTPICKKNEINHITLAMATLMKEQFKYS